MQNDNNTNTNNPTTLDQAKKALQTTNNASKKLDGTIANNTMLVIVDFLKGKKRDDYKQLEKDITGKMVLNAYSKQVLKKCFEYKSLKIISKLDLIPYTKITKLIAIIDNENKLRDELMNLGKDDQTKKEYLELIDTFLENHKIVKTVKIDIEKESKKLIENLEKSDLEKLIVLLQTGLK